MSYVRRVLQPGETVVYETRLHRVIYLRAMMALIVCVILAGSALSGIANQTRYLSLALWIGAAIFALFVLSAGLAAFVRRATTELAITDHRVIYKSGMLSRHTLEMNRSKVESVDVNQTLLGRVLGYGTIIVRGTGGSLEPMRRMTDPLTFRSQITAADPSRG